MATDVVMSDPMDLGKPSAVSLANVEAEGDLYVKLKTLQRQLEFIEIQVRLFLWCPEARVRWYESHHGVVS